MTILWDRYILSPSIGRSSPRSRTPREPFMEAPKLQSHPTSGPNLRLLEGKDSAVEPSFASLRAWVVLFGSLSFAGGHGVFLFTALTRLSKVPARAEIGAGFELVVLAWFLLAAPLALASAGLRRRFLQLSSPMAWSLASGALVATLSAFAYYLSAIALA